MRWGWMVDIVCPLIPALSPPGETADHGVIFNVFQMARTPDSE